MKRSAPSLKKSSSMQNTHSECEEITEPTRNLPDCLYVARVCCLVACLIVFPVSFTWRFLRFCDRPTCSFCLVLLKAFNQIRHLRSCLFKKNQPACLWGACLFLRYDSYRHTNYFTKKEETNGVCLFVFTRRVLLPDWLPDCL